MSIQDPTPEEDDGARCIQAGTMNNTAEMLSSDISHDSSPREGQLQELAANQQSSAAATASAASDDTKSPLVTLSVPKSKICGVCNDEVSKYKCTRCYLPYCSLACSTIHKATHPIVTAPAPAHPATTEADGKTEKTNGAIARAGTVAAAGARGPFAGLDGSAELRALFGMYPRLGGQLEEIYMAMQEPARGEDGAMTGYMRAAGRAKGERKAWSVERGMEDGRAALGRARERWGKDGEGVREFGDLVLRIVGGVEEAETGIQRELTEQDRMIVERLLHAGL